MSIEGAAGLALCERFGNGGLANRPVRVVKKDVPVRPGNRLPPISAINALGALEL